MPPEPVQRPSRASSNQTAPSTGSRSVRRSLNSSSLANSLMKPSSSSSLPLGSTTSNPDFFESPPPTVPSTPARPPPLQRSNHGGIGMAYNPYVMGGMGMGGMGMGIGGMGYGGYGMPYGNPFASILMGPMQVIYSINYFVMCLGQVGDLLGMSSSALTQLSQQLLHFAKQFEMFLRKSSLRRWLQRKSKKSALFRWLCVFAGMCLSYQVTKLLQHVLRQYLGGKKSITASLSTATNVKSTAGTTVVANDIASSVINSGS